MRHLEADFGLLSVVEINRRNGLGIFGGQSEASIDVKGAVGAFGSGDTVGLTFGAGLRQFLVRRLLWITRGRDESAL